MKFIKTKKNIFAVVVLICIATQLVDATESDRRIGVDARAREILEQLSKSYAQIPSVEVDCVTRIDSNTKDGPSFTREMNQRLFFRRPDGLAVRVLRGSAPAPEIFYLKKEANVVIPGIGVVGRRISNLPSMFRTSTFGFDSNKESNPVLDQNIGAAIVREMLIPQPKEAWDKDIVGFELIRDENKNPMESGIRMTQKTKDKKMSFDIWVTKEAQPKLLRVHSHPQEVDGKQIRYRSNFSNWKFDTKLNDEAFAVTKTKLRKFSSLRQALRASRASRHEELAIRDRLRHRPVDDLIVTFIDGSEKKLSELRGSNVMVIDFWASWSTSCLEMIPKWQTWLEKEKYKGVMYVMANQGESAELVKQFVETRGWKNSIVVDPERKFGKALDVQGLPQTIVVGDDGRIVDVLFRIQNENEAKAVLDAALETGSDAKVESIAELRDRQKTIKQVVRKNSPAVVGLMIQTSNGRMGGGSGVIVSPDGLILTAAHVTANARDFRVQVMLQDGTRVPGKVLGSNGDRDSSMIKMEENGVWPYAEYAKSDPDLGEWIISMGHPGGFASDRPAPVRVGRVVKRADESGVGRGFLGTDGTITPGDSGGPAFDLDGRVVGIHSFISFRLEENMHVPISTYLQDWDRLERGDVWGRGTRRSSTRPVLGIILKDTGDGLRVDEFDEDSPAKEAGFQIGDILKQVGNLADVKNKNLLRKEMALHRGGDKIKVVVKRGDELVDIELTLGRR